MSRIGKSTLFVLLSITWGYTGATPRWIDHASIPGPDAPDAGQSRFDQLFLQDGNRHQIPYPFSSLIEFLETRIDNAGQNGVRLALIPLGRSLQRNAPAPDFFQFPRAVIALEGEPVTAGNSAGEVLKYRLFIAHHPKTSTLEIISYNDTAGRFEFQVVENYGPAQFPQVRQANRVMCLSCHQNAAPIFAKRPWSETNFNVEIAKKLVVAQPQKFDSLIDVVTADAGVIDLLTERANYLAAAQLIWQQGCQTMRCRAALLRAILQYRLSGEASFDSNHPRYRKDYYDELTRNWESTWPEGLALANSRIIDRNPLATGPAPIAQDPLSPRPAHATWYRTDPILARGIVYRLAGFLTLADIQRIDRHLVELSRDQSPATRKYRADCGFEAATDRSNILTCGYATTSAGLQASFDIEFQQDGLESMRVTKLRIPQDTNLQQPAISRLRRFQGGLDAELSHAKSGLTQRLANGDRVKSVLLRWDDSLSHSKVSLEVEVVADFQFIDQALLKLLDKNQRALGESLADSAFRRKPVMRELAQALGMQAMQWRKTVPTVLKTVRSLPGTLNDELALLRPYCSHCHADATVNPPGFLSGNQLETGILQCAPRMLARLKAWQPGTDFPASPMPPPASLAITGTTIEAWPKSAHYRTLVASLERLVRKNHPAEVNDYGRLPPCLVGTNE